MVVSYLREGCYLIRVDRVTSKDIEIVPPALEVKEVELQSY